MGKRLFSLAALLVTGLGLPSVALAGALAEGDVAVFLEGRPQHSPNEGYVTVPVTLRNGDSRSHTVELEAMSGPQMSVTRSVALEPGEKRLVFLYTPALWRYASVVARVDGHSPQHTEGLSMSYDNAPPVLAEGARTTAERVLADFKEDQDPSHSLSTRPLARVEKEFLPDHLAGYLGYAGVAVLDTRLEELPEPTRRALEAYAATGGTLLVAHAPGRPEAYLPMLPKDADAASGAAYGFGRIFLCADECGGATVSAFATATAELLRPAAALSDDVSPIYYGAGSPLAKQLPTDRQYLLTIARAPVGAFALIVLAFALVIGPGSFMVRRRFGPPALLAFVPGTALVTCLGIGGYGALHEGLFTVHSSFITATFLDAEHHRAATVAVEGWFASFAPSNVRYEGDTAVLLNDRNWIDHGLAMDESKGLDFKGGLIPSRSYREYVVTSVEATRARFTARVKGDGVEVENALGADVVDGQVRLGRKICTFHTVKDGGRASANCDPHQAPPHDLGAELSKRFEPRVLVRSFAKPLGDGEFAARLETAAFAPTGGLSLSRNHDVQLVRGKVSP